MIITSASNEKLKDIKKLLKSSKERYEKGVYVVEGIRMFKEIPKEDIISVFVSENAFEKHEDIINDTKIEPYILPDKLYSGISDTITPQGIMAVVKMKERTLDEVLDNGTTPFIIITEKLQDPGNMGTIIRTAEGAGVTGIIVSKDSVDIYNPKTIRSTMGSIFRVPIYVSDNLVEDIAYTKKKGINIYAAHLNGEDFYSKDFTSACGFLIGNEGNGLSDEISNMADELIRIPMCGKVESLNAGTSTAVITYEVLRQRKFN